MDMSVTDELFKRNHSQVIRKTRHKTKGFAYDLGLDLLGQHYKVAVTKFFSFVTCSARPASSPIKGVLASVLSGVSVFVLRVFFLGVSATSSAWLSVAACSDSA